MLLARLPSYRAAQQCIMERVCDWFVSHTKVQCSIPQKQYIIWTVYTLRTTFALKVSKLNQKNQSTYHITTYNIISHEIKENVVLIIYYYYCSYDFWHFNYIGSKYKMPRANM